MAQHISYGAQGGEIHVVSSQHSTKDWSITRMGVAAQVRLAARIAFRSRLGGRRRALRLGMAYVVMASVEMRRWAAARRGIQPARPRRYWRTSFMEHSMEH